MLFAQNIENSKKIINTNKTREAYMDIKCSHYPRNMVIYPYPLFGVIFMAISHVFII